MSNVLYYSFGAILLGAILDSLLGDPERLPHPVRVFGNLINAGEKYFNKDHARKLKGLFLGAALVVLTGLFFWAVLRLLSVSPLLTALFEGICIFYGISNRSLIDEALKVEKNVQKNNLAAARQQLSRIVGRDTSNLTFHQIRTAILETVSENLSDGVVAPLFYYALGGVPLMMAYKMVNTLDSMLGYKNDRYRDFGWFSAKLDDVANFIPARLTALLMVMLPPNKNAWHCVLRHSKHHASPNSGYPEAALAGILNCRFGGPNIYHGQLVDKPYIGDNDRQLNHDDILKACLVNVKTTLGTFILLLVFTFMQYRLF